MTPTFRIRAIRVYTADDRRIERGDVLDVSAADAAYLVCKGYAVLVNPRDLRGVVQVLGIHQGRWTTPATR